MEKSILIKLRQGEANDVTQNGAYNVSLKEAILLEEGDVVKMHTAILDTSSESFVILDEDTLISMKVAQYVRNYKSDYPAVTTYQHNPVINNSQPDLNVNITCREDVLTGDEFKLSGITVFGKHNSASKKTDEIVVDYHYNDPHTGTRVNSTVTIPPFAPISHQMKGFSSPINKLMRGKSAVIDTAPADFDAAGIHAQGFSGNKGAPYPFMDVGTNPIDPTNTSSAVVFDQELAFTIPAGRYLPSEMATILNDEMSALQSLGTVGYNVAANKYPVRSAFLGTLAQAYHLVESPIVDGGLNKTIVWMPSTPNNDEFPTDSLTYGKPIINADDRFIGANEVSLNYDETLKKLNFDALHMPFYVGGSADNTGAGGGQPGAVYPPLLNLQPDDGSNVQIPQIPQQNYGGCFFTHLSPTNFWANQLGFTNITVHPEIADTATPRLGGKDDLLMSRIFLTPGKNIVTAFQGLDNIVFKSDTFNIPKLGDISQPLTTPIISSREFDTPKGDEGYFLIEVGMNLPQKMVGGSDGGITTTSNQVQAVCGKFYTQGNFLQDTGQGSVVYQHKGEPQLLSDMSVTIRNANMTMPEVHDLGNKNSIFLELIKTVPPPQPPN